MNALIEKKDVKSKMSKIRSKGKYFSLTKTKDESMFIFQRDMNGYFGIVNDKGEELFSEKLASIKVTCNPDIYVLEKLVKWEHAYCTGDQYIYEYRLFNSKNKTVSKKYYSIEDQEYPDQFIMRQKTKSSGFHEIIIETSTFREIKLEKYDGVERSKFNNGFFILSSMYRSYHFLDKEGNVISANYGSIKNTDDPEIFLVTERYEEEYNYESDLEDNDCYYESDAYRSKPYGLISIDGTEITEIKYDKLEVTNNPSIFLFELSEIRGDVYGFLYKNGKILFDNCSRLSITKDKNVYKFTKTDGSKGEVSLSELEKSLL